MLRQALRTAWAGLSYTTSISLRIKSKQLFALHLLLCLGVWGYLHLNVQSLDGLLVALSCRYPHVHWHLRYLDQPGLSEVMSGGWCRVREGMDEGNPMLPRNTNVPVICSLQVLNAVAVTGPRHRMLALRSLAAVVL